MGYMFTQIWLWLLLAFVLGAIVAWLLDRMIRRPRVAVSDERFFEQAKDGRGNGTAKGSAGNRRAKTV